MNEKETREVKTKAPDAVAEPAQEVVYSKNYKRPQKAERSMTSASHRLANAVLVGIETWEKERDKSARKKKDGAMRDAPENYAKAYGEAVREASRAPEEFIKGVKVYMPKTVQKFFGLR